MRRGICFSFWRSRSGCQQRQSLLKPVVKSLPDMRVRFVQRCAKIAARVRRIGARNIQYRNQERNYIG